MKTILKNQYQSPRTDVLEVKIEGFVCQTTPNNAQTQAGYGDLTPTPSDELDGD